MNPTTQTFIDYFHNNYWGNESSSSGPNSDPRFTPQLIQRLQTLFEQLKPESILDLGCGDANLFQSIDIAQTPYLGMDCVPALINRCQQVFSDQPNMQFQEADILTFKLPKADLVICRDVVHYLPNDWVQQLLDHIIAAGSRYLLITHNTHCSMSANDPTEVGKFRPVNLCYPPFSWPQPSEEIPEDFLAKSLGLWDLNTLK